MPEEHRKHNREFLRTSPVTEDKHRASNNNTDGASLTFILLWNSLMTNLWHPFHKGGCSIACCLWWCWYNFPSATSCPLFHRVTLCFHSTIPQITCGKNRPLNMALLKIWTSVKPLILSVLTILLFSGPLFSCVRSGQFHVFFGTVNTPLNFPFFPILVA